MIACMRIGAQMQRVVELTTGTVLHHEKGDPTARVYYAKEPRKGCIGARSLKPALVHRLIYWLLPAGRELGYFARQIATLVL